MTAEQETWRAQCTPPKRGSCASGCSARELRRCVLPPPVHIHMNLRPSTRVGVGGSCGCRYFLHVAWIWPLCACGCRLCSKVLIAPGSRDQNWEEAYVGALGISEHWGCEFEAGKGNLDRRTGRTVVIGRGWRWAE